MSQSLLGMYQSFVWFFGIVEDRNDPLKLGRCRVRCFGYHTQNKTLLPTEDLPWASLVVPANTNEKIIKPPKDGSWVLGFFQDGESAQFPIIFGIIPSIPTKAADSSVGFSDQRSANNSLEDFPNRIKEKTFSLPGIISEITGLPQLGVTIVEDSTKSYPDTSDLNKPDTSVYATGDGILTSNNAILERIQNKVTSIPIAQSDSSFDRETYDEPSTGYNAKYPFNHVFETESGHVIEVDDTKGYERIHIYHRTGTFIEILPDGSITAKTIGDDNKIVMKDSKLYIMGDCDITVQGDSNIYTQKTSTIETGEDLFLNVAGSLHVKVGMDITEEVTGVHQETVGRDKTTTADNIYLNP